MSWSRSADGARDIFFNRDEKKTRSIAEPPAERELNGTRFLSPRDSDGNGTWMFANQHGLVVCLLNRWHEHQAPTAQGGSRGRLVWEFGDATGAEEVGTRLAAESLAGLQAFTLVVLDPTGIHAWDWTQLELRQATPNPPLTSSSFRFPDVLKSRLETYASIAGTGDNPPADRLGAFQSELGPDGPSAFGIRMCRPDAQTMSRSHLHIAEGTIRWDYWEEAPEFASPPRLFQSELPLTERQLP